MRLVKYCDAGGIEVIRTSSIKVTPAVELNDPFDCNPTFDTQTPESRAAFAKMVMGASVVMQALERDELPPGATGEVDHKELLAAWEQKLQQKLNEPAAVQAAFGQSRALVGVLCLSEVKNEPLMWAHYASGHKGLVIEFESDMLVGGKAGKHLTDAFYEVQYSGRRPVYRFDQQTMIECLRHKAESWSYEKEWRATYLMTQFEQRVIAGKEMCLRTFDPQCIKAVYLGSCMPGPHQAEVLRLLTREQHEGVELYQMKIDESGYALRAVEVPIPGR